MPEIITVRTKPFEGQKPGTSGLRKSVKTFQQINYLENFIQSILDVSLKEVKNRKTITLVIGGDGRYYSKEAISTIISICAANQIGRLIIAQNGIMSTPAISAVIRVRQAHGGIILTASHNPGGLEGDFGVKYNCSNGGPAPDNITNQIYARTQEIYEYKILKLASITSIVDLGQLGEQKFKYSNQEEMIIEIIDSVQIYLDLLKTIFDFDLLRRFVVSKKLLIDAMNGVMGPYVKRIIVKELGAGENAAIRCEPLEDFGGIHPDPNLTYAADLVERMHNGNYDFGAAFDGDGDRNMIVGAKGFFVTPSDSLAILADNLDCIAYFNGNIKGYARSMPTSRAIDNVAKKTGQKCYETPTGWKYFGSLLDAGLVSICGEESFGTGSDHIREKDGMWAVLAWLSIMASFPEQTVQSIVKDHWHKYGRCYYARYDYENCQSKPCQDMIAALEKKIIENQLPETIKILDRIYKLHQAYNFQYTDPISNENSARQGLVLLFNGGYSRIVFRLSGTGSSGATIRIYLEQYEPDPNRSNDSLEEYIQPLAEIALKLSALQEFTGREKPTVIT